MQRNLTAFYRHQKVVRRLAWFAVQLVRQGLPQLRELAQGCRLITAQRMKPHQELVGKLMAWLDAHQFLGDAGVGEAIGRDQFLQMVGQGHRQS